MKTLIGLLFWGGIGYYLYLKFKEGKKKKTVRPRILKKQQPITRTVNSTKDDFNYLKRELRKLYKKAEDMERYDEDGLDDIKVEIKNLENIINPYEVQQLVEKVTDLKSYRSLEKKLENSNYGDTIEYDEVQRRDEVVEEALEKAGEKPYKYVVYADVDLNTPLSLLKEIGKSYFPDKAIELDKSYDQSYLQLVTFSENEDLEYYENESKEEAKENGLQDLKRLRSIIESHNLADLEKQKKFNSLVSKSEILKELYFDDNGKNDFYKQYVYNLPH